MTHLPAHLTDNEIRRGERDLQRSRKRDRSQRTVRGDPDIVRLRHVGDPPRPRDPPGVGDVRLNDIDASGFQVRSPLLTAQPPLTTLFKFKSIRIQVSESTSLVTIISLAPDNPSNFGTHSDRDRSLLIKLLHLGYLPRQERLFDEQRLMRFQRLGELFSQGLVDSSVEVAFWRSHRHVSGEILDEERSTGRKLTARRRSRST